MAEYTRRERNVRHLEILVPRGSAIAELSKAWYAAGEAWDELNPGVARDSDDWARIDADDEYVIIRITTESASDGA